ncbi:hypothetical protein KI387_017912 [Taxus chinensis]|uniref:BCAS3 domain-containing protein n=1 Tax=Taxus chinensis TaxID=29808 RepID=A0AA38GJV3_TAXCH|nr:hypothetical protein KI387_017912 [Taxus chinensis]
MRNAGNDNKLQPGRGGQGSNRSSSSSSSSSHGRGFFPTSLRVIQNYLRSATSVASTVRSAGASVASSLSLPEDDSHRDQVQWAGFDKLEVGANVVRSVLLLGFMHGFQVWDVEDVDDVRELISKQDGRVAFLQMQPRPITTEQADERFNAARPLLLVVTGDGTPAGGNVQSGYGSGYGGGAGNPPQPGSNNFVPTVVLFYSLRSHSYVHVLRFRQAVYTVRCSARFVAIALASQIRCYDAVTLEDTFSVLTYPIPQGVHVAGNINIGYGPLAVGPRWLAYAGNQGLYSNTGRISPQHLTPSPGVSPSTSPANGSLVAHYAKESSKQIAAGIVTLGDMGYKTFTKYYSELLPDGANSPRSGSPSWRHSGNGLPGHAHEPDYAGTVIVRDYVSKSVVAQFRAHTSPLSALCFDPSGTLLVTASVHGHNLNVFRIMPFLGGNGSSSAGFDVNASYVHLYKLSRGVTNAVIQDISFSDDSHWIAISSSRGTSHLFAISPFGGAVSLHTHEGTCVDESRVSLLVPSRTIQWWSSPGPLRANQQSLPQPAPPVTLSVVSRIKNGNGGWRGTVSGAAAVATGRTTSTGAIAAFFRNGGGGGMQSDIGNFSSKDELWVFSPSGHVMQYALRLSNGVETGYSSDIASGIGGTSCEPILEQNLRVVVETLRKWDVCQIPIRVEREEDINELCKNVASSEQTGKNGVGGYRNGIVPPYSREIGKGGINLEEKHHWYLSNAEVQMLQARSPIWAKSEVYFQVLRPECMDAGLFNEDAYSGEIEIERVPTRAVEVRTKDLIPVFDNFQDFKEVQGERALLRGSLAGAKNLNTNQHKDECTQDILNGMSLGCVPIQRSSSGSSCGSVGGFPVGHTIIANGYHHVQQDSQEHLEGMFYSDSLTMLRQHLPCPTSSEKAALLESSKDYKVKNMDLNGKSTSEVANPTTLWQQPMDIPRSNRASDCNIQAHENSVQMNSCSRSLPANGYGFGKKHVKNDVTDAVGLIFEGHIVHDIVSAKLDLGCHLRSKVSSAKNENHSTTSELHVKGISTQHLNENHMHGMDLAINSCTGDQFQSDNGMVGGIQNTYHCSTMEDSISGEHEEDAWEGGMFPFCDEGKFLLYLPL